MAPPSHFWMVPLVEDMLHDIRISLTEAVVTDPGRAVLFYERHSLGECLTVDKARDTAFLLTGVGILVGKPTYLSAEPMTIQEGQQAIAQAVMDCHVRTRGPEHPHVNLMAQQPFRFEHLRASLIKDTYGNGGSDTQPLPCQPKGVETAINIGGTKGFHCLSSHHLSQTDGLRVTGTCYQWLPQCHLHLIDQMDPSIPIKGDGTKRMEAI